MNRLFTTLTLALSLAAGAWAQSDHPCLTVARTAQAPALDGRIDADEWRDAASIGLFLSKGAQAVAQPGTRAHLTFDEGALYVAVQCLEPDPRRPRGYARAHDDRAFEDDCVPVFVAPEDLRQAGPAQVNFGGYEGAYQKWYQDLQACFGRLAAQVVALDEEGTEGEAIISAHSFSSETAYRRRLLTMSIMAARTMMLPMINSCQ